ncbi:TPA: tetratricopeptide repeat protein [Candidatus Scatousia excrementigallinarum]|uniref:Tetratricopeptide repeat protein n=1 Tax=Candidatus Scatousia excrementigallinarum TaxID=2840935 RepID=A0A9D1JMB2_9BACT|nr:tetratricopeptide repeat protein [Candidatus Scatousia excrementigallinarum]
MADEKDYKYYTNLGIEQTNLQKFDEALEALDKAIELNPNSPLAYFSKAIVFHNLNQLQAAYENYSKAIELNPGMIDAYYNRAQAILAYDDPNEDELREALADLKKATELDKKFVDAYYYMAVVLKKLGCYKEAVKSLDKVLELEPQAVYSKALKKLILQKYLK